MEELTSGEEELRLLVETIPALVWRAAPGGDIEYVNKRALEYFGAPADVPHPLAASVENVRSQFLSLRH